MPAPRSRRGTGLRAAEARAGLLGNALENPGDVVRGAVTAPFTAAPDMLGMAAQMYNVAMRPLGAPPMQNPISGDPIREAAGLDPQSSAGLLGEFMDPSSAIGKGVKAVRSLLGNVDKVAPTGLLGAMTLYHGTPHKFDRFDLSKIGTGEGAQAYGHGLYFAEDPGVAGNYRVNLSFDPEKMRIGDVQINDYYDTLQNKANRLPPDAAQESYERAGLIERLMDNESPESVESWADSLGHGDWFRKEIKPNFQSYGHLYEVDIPDEVVDNMLDWDAPLSEQPEGVRRAFAELRDKFDLQDADGHIFYRDIQAKMPSDDPNIRQQMASQLLRERGIPGIRFWDGKSRAAGEGTRNIVLFDPENIREVKRDGEVVFNRL